MGLRWLEECLERRWGLGQDEWVGLCRMVDQVLRIGTGAWMDGVGRHSEERLVADGMGWDGMG